MKNLFVILVWMVLSSCASTRYTQDEFNNENYQKNIQNLVGNSDFLKDFANDTNNIIDTNDIGILVQADLYFNQGDCVGALPLYEQLSYKYKIPKIIYKAILCYAKSSLSQDQIGRLNKLVDLFIKTAPDANFSKILRIKQSLYEGNLRLAKTNIDNLIKNDLPNARSHLLFLSLIFSDNSVDDIDKTAFDEFASYILDNYSEFPEAYLLATTTYATTNNISNLSITLDKIKELYPSWQIPLFWNVVILSSHGRYKSIAAITFKFAHKRNPDPVVQNIYVGALVNSDQIFTALSYLKNYESIANSDNIQLNLGIVYAKNKSYNNVLTHLIKVKPQSVVVGDLLNLYIGLIYDMQRNYSEAIKYYKKVSDGIEKTAANTMLFICYYRLFNEREARKILTQIVKDKKIHGVDSILFEAKSYISINDYFIAYEILKANYQLYKENSDFIYLYSSVLARLHKTNEAIKMYKYYIELAPKSAYGYNDLAYLYLEQSNNNKLALKYARRAAAIDVTDYNILDTLGWAYYKMGDYIDAYPFINSGYQTNPTTDGAVHLKAVLTALNKPMLASHITIINESDFSNETASILSDKILGLLMLLQYGLVGNNL